MLIIVYPRNGFRTCPIQESGSYPWVFDGEALIAPRDEGCAEREASRLASCKSARGPRNPIIAGMRKNTDPALTGRGTRQHVAVQRPTRSFEPTKPSPDQSAAVSRGLKDKIAWLAIDDLKPFPYNP